MFLQDHAIHQKDTSRIIPWYANIILWLNRLLSGFFFLWRRDPTRVVASSFTRFLDHTQRRTTVGRTPLDEWSARRRYLYLTTHNTHNRQTSMSLVGFEPMISAGERPQTYALDRAATGTGFWLVLSYAKNAYFLRFRLLVYSNQLNCFAS